MIDHLQKQALTYQLAYTLCSVVVDLRISQTVDAPNLLASTLLPLDILCVAPRVPPAGCCYPRRACRASTFRPFF